MKKFRIKELFHNTPYKDRFWYKGISPKTNKEKMFNALTQGHLRYIEFRRYRNFSYQTIKDMHDYVTSKGGFFVILDLPEDPSGKDLHKKVGKLYTQFFTDLIKEEIHYVNLQDASGFNSKDFYDMVHMLPSGRDKFRPMFLEMVKGHIKEFGI